MLVAYTLFWIALAGLLVSIILGVRDFVLWLAERRDKRSAAIRQHTDDAVTQALMVAEQLALRPITAAIEVVPITRKGRSTKHKTVAVASAALREVDGSWQRTSGNP